MKVFDVGPDPLADYEFEFYLDQSYEWFVYSYCSSYYDGSGVAVGYKEGDLYIYDLGHCSCYGPLENNYSDKISVERFLISDDIHDADIGDPDVKAKVLELLN